MGVENIRRAEWAKDALTVFTKETYGGDIPLTMERGDLETAIGDLICDLLHFANQNGFEPEVIHQHALDTYDGEINDNE